LIELKTSKPTAAAPWAKLITALGQLPAIGFLVDHAGTGKTCPIKKPSTGNL